LVSGLRLRYCEAFEFSVGVLDTVRQALISDIHANLEALSAVLNDIAAQEVDEIVCLGDIVGYGPLQVCDSWES
jgi:hypothetical protein